MSNNVHPRWTLEADNLLRQLWEVENKTSGQCAKEMGVTRNSIIGRVGRMKLEHSNRPESQPRPRTVKRLRRSNYANSREVVIETVEEACDLPPERSDFLVSLMDRKSHQCCWIIGEVHGADTMYCGARKVDGSSFCPRHHRMAYRKSPIHVTDEERTRRAAHWRKIVRAYKADHLVDIENAA